MEQNLANQIIRSHRRTLSLEITTDAQLIIRAPMRTSIEEIHRIIDQKRLWILQKQQKAKANYRPSVVRQFKEGEEFLYLGQSYPLKVITDWKRPFEFNGSEFLIGDQFVRHAKRLLETWYINRAKELFPARAELYSSMAGQRYSRITLSNAKTRWGSCNSRKSLNFNWRLIMAPLDKIDYVVAHEVAHLEELNHSWRFWAKVKSLMPDYKIRQQWFKQHGNLLRF
jgi:predicted metal-dependent hydrolase